MFTKRQREGLLIMLLLSKRLILSAAWVVPLQEWTGGDGATASCCCYQVVNSFTFTKFFFSITVNNESEIDLFFFVFQTL